MTDQFLPAIIAFMKAKKAGHPWKDKGGKFSTEESDEDGQPHHFTGRFTTKQKPGWKKITYVDAKVTFSYDKESKRWMLGGKPASDEDDQFLKHYVTPPSWERVQINADPKGNTAVIGYDKKGKRQYRMFDHQKKAAAAEKFDRLKDFAKALPGIREAVKRDLASSDEKTRMQAAVVYLIDRTAFRVGGEGDGLAEKKAFGASTLLGSHVKIKGDTVTFDFTAKKGVQVQKSITDAEFAKAMRKLVSGVKAKDRIFPESLANDKKVRVYLKRISKDDFSPKDFRTYHGTAVALKALSGKKIPSNDDELKQLQKEVSKVVAEHLGNTPSVAFSAYIDPAVWKKFTPKG